MSSFVINKEDYVKAAGLVAGISAANDLWIYSYEYNKKMEQEEFYKKFIECFEMNALSVQEQYRDEEPETDSNSYTDVFKKCFMKGKTAHMNYKTEQKIFFDLRHFFKSSLYQTEKESYYFKMKMFYNEIIMEMVKIFENTESESWGSLDEY